MKKLLGYLLFTLIVVSCSTSGGTFRLKGKFKNFNQGELFVYSLMGRGRVDTIRLTDGRFNYEIPLEDTVLLSVLFPNYSEIPVIAVPGKTLTMEGSASMLREVKVEGTEENHKLTQFRLMINEKMPPEVEKTAADFISENPASLGSLYVLNKYFLLKKDASYAKAATLAAKMIKAAPDMQIIKGFDKKLVGLSKTKVGDRLPAFSAVTMKGRQVSLNDLKGDVNIISLWATWNYESQSIQRQLRRLKKKYGQRLQLISICIDGNAADCRQTSSRDSLSWPIVCDGRMWESPLVSQFGFYAVPDVIVADRNGRIVARQLASGPLNEEIEKRMK